MAVRHQHSSSATHVALSEEAPNHHIAADPTRHASPPSGAAPAHITSKRERQALLLRNVGLLWLALGSVMTALSVTSGPALELSVWLWLGAACCAASCFRNVRSVRTAAVATDTGTASLISDAEWQRILGEVETRRARPSNVHDLMPRTSTPQQFRARFAWQHQQGRLSEAGLRHRLATVDALERALEPAFDPARRDATRN